MQFLTPYSPIFSHIPSNSSSDFLFLESYTKRFSIFYSGHVYSSFKTRMPSAHRNLCNLNSFHFVLFSGTSSFGNGYRTTDKNPSGSFDVCGSQGHFSPIMCSSRFDEERDDEFYMRRCVQLARKAVGCTSPNPMVGCVIVKNGQIVGEGFHPKAGQPHAEVFALNEAGDHAKNATAYVSLEPCNHYGRTPPCTEALVQAKVKHVVVGMVDPNPIVASKGVERLRGAGIEVTVGVEEKLCRKLNEAYIHKMVTGKPFVTLRYSSSFNGLILNQAKCGEDSNGYYPHLLQENDGVIISSTSLASNADIFTFLNRGTKRPLLLVIADATDSSLDLPALTPDIAQRAVIFADKTAIIDLATQSKLRDWGAEIVVLDCMDLDPVIGYCGRQGLCSILIDFRADSSAFCDVLEGGIEKGLLHKTSMEVHPLWLGSKDGSISGFGRLGRRQLKMKELQSRILEEGSVLVEGYLC